MASTGSGIRSWEGYTLSAASSPDGTRGLDSGRRTTVSIHRENANHFVSSGMAHDLSLESFGRMPLFTHT